MWDDVVHFFMMLRDKGLTMQKVLKLTPASHTIFEQYMEKILVTRDFKDDVERAVAVFYCLNLTYAGKLDDTWVCRRERNSALPMKRKIDDFEWFIERMREIVIENMDFEECIKRHDNEGTLFYCDPPYLLDSNREDYYQRRFVFRDHWRLAKVLQDIRGKVAISYYPMDEVEDLYPKNDGWYYFEKKVIKQSATVARGETKPFGIELLITNYDMLESKINTPLNQTSLTEVFG